MIKKVDGGYEVRSEKGKRLSKKLSLRGARKRLQQIEYFKHRDSGRKVR